MSTPGAARGEGALPAARGPDTAAPAGETSPSRHRQVAATASSTADPAIRPCAYASRASAQHRSAASGASPASASRSPAAAPPAAGPSSPASSACSADHSTCSRASAVAAGGRRRPRAARRDRPRRPSGPGPARRSSSGNGRCRRGCSPTRSATRRASGMPTARPAAPRAGPAARGRVAAPRPAHRPAGRPRSARRVEAGHGLGRVRRVDRAARRPPASAADVRRRRPGTHRPQRGRAHPARSATTGACIQCVSVCTCPARTHLATRRAELLARRSRPRSGRRTPPAAPRPAAARAAPARRRRPATARAARARPSPRRNRRVRSQSRQRRPRPTPRNRRTSCPGRRRGSSGGRTCSPRTPASPPGSAWPIRPWSALTHAREGWCAESSERACRPSAYSVVFSPSSFSVTTTSRPRRPDRSATRTIVGGGAGGPGQMRGPRIVRAHRERSPVTAASNTST